MSRDATVGLSREYLSLRDKFGVQKTVNIKHSTSCTSDSSFARLWDCLLKCLPHLSYHVE